MGPFAGRVGRGTETWRCEGEAQAIEDLPDDRRALNHAFVASVSTELDEVPAERRSPSSCRRSGDRDCLGRSCATPKEAQTNDGVCEKAGPSEVSVCAGDHFVEPGNSLMNLSADATNEKIAKRRQFTENQSRTVLYWSVCLRQRRQNDIRLPHGAYSGLLSRTIEGV